MSQTIDDRVVKLTFDNKQFESGVKTSLETLDKLDKSLKLKDGTKGLEQLNAAVQHVDLTALSAGVDELNHKLSVTGTISRTVVSELTKKGMEVVGKAVETVTSKISWMNNKLTEGGKTRATNIAQAKFQLKGLGIAWETVADDIDYAVSGTAYGLDSAAKACAQLSASQVQAGDDMKAALRGISGVAAMTNSEYDEIAQIFTTVAGNGRLMTDQLNQMSYKGLNAAASLAQAFNESEEMAAWFYESYTAHAKKSDEAIQKGAKITETAIRTLVTNGGLDFEHFAAAMDSAFGEHAKEADNTFSGALANVGAAMSKIGAEFAGPFYNNMINPLNRLKAIFNEFRGIIQPAIDAFNELEFVVSAKIEKILYKIQNALGTDSVLGKVFQGIGDFISGIARELGGEEMEILDKVKAAGPDSMKTADAIEKANEAIRTMRNAEIAGAPITIDEAIKQVMGSTIAATGATSEYSSELRELAKNVNLCDKEATEGGYTGWDALTAKIKEAGGSVEEYEEILKQVAKDHGENIEGLLEDYGDGFAALFATGELGTEVATEALDQYISKIDETVAANERLRASSGEFTHTAQEMHDAIQSIWSEKQGLSWEERERILTEKGFSKAEIDEIHAVVNEMQESGRTLSSDIDTVYEEIDSTIDKTVEYNEEQMKKFARDEERYFGEATESAKKGTQSTADTVLSTFDKVRTTIMGTVGSIGAAFSNVFFSKEKKPLEQMTGVEKVFTGLFNVMKVGGQAAWEGLKAAGNGISNLWGKFKETPVFSFLSDKVNGLIDAMNNLTWEGVKQKYDSFKDSITSSPVWTTIINGWNKVVEFFDGLDLFGKISKAFKNFSFKDIKDNLTETLDAIHEQGLLNVIISKWTQFKDWIKDFHPFEAISNWFSDLNLSSIGETISNVISSIKQSIHDLFFGTGDVEAAETGSGPIGQLNKLEEKAGNVGTVFDKLKGVVDTVVPYLKKVWSNIIEPLFKGTKFTDLLQGGKILAIIGVLAAIRKFIKGFSGLGKAVTRSTTLIGEGLSAFITQLNGLDKTEKALNKAKAREANTAAIKNMAIAIGVLAGSLIMLSNVPVENLKTAGVAILQIAVVLGALTLAATAFMAAKAKLAAATNHDFSSKNPLAPLHDGFEQLGKGINEIGKGVKLAALAALIMTVVAAIFALYFAIKLYAGMDTDVFVKGGAKVAAILAALTISMSIMSAACKGAGLGLLGVAPAIIAITVALAAMAGVLKLYSLMSDDTFETGGKRAALVLLALTAAISIMGLALKNAKPTAMLAAAAMLVTMTAAIVTLSAAIVALGFVPKDNLIKGGAVVAAMIAGITAAISVMGKALKNTRATTMLSAAVAIMAMTAAIVVLSAAMAALSLIPAGKLIKAGLALSIVLGALKGFAKEASQMQGTATSVLAMTAMLGVIAYSLYQLSMIKATNLVAPTAAISALLIFLKGFAKSASGLDAGKTALSILAISGMLAAIAGVLWFLSNYSDVDKYLPIVGSLAGVLTALTVVIKVLGSMPPTGGIVAAANIIGLVGLIAAFGLLLAGLEELSDGGLSNALEHAGDMLGKLGEVIGKFVGGIAAGALEKVGEVPTENFEKIADFVSKIAAINIPSQTEFKWDSEGLSFVDKSLLSFSLGMKGIVSAINDIDFNAEDIEIMEEKRQYFDDIVGFVGGLAAIDIPVQSSIKLDFANGVFENIDQSLKTFGKGMQEVVTAVNAVEFDQGDIESMDEKRQYFDDIAGFVSGLAAIPIPIQTSIKLDLANGVFESIDQSLESFGQGMQEVVTAVNNVEFDQGDIDSLDEKKQYFDDIVEFVGGLAAIPIPVQTLFKLSVFDGTLEYVNQSLESFGQGMQEVVTAVNAVDLGDTSELDSKREQFDIIAGFVRGLAEIDIPEQESFKAHFSLFGGDVEVKDSSLVKFAEGMKAVSDTLNGMTVPQGVTEADVQMMANCVAHMANAASHIEGWNSGIKTLWEENSLSAFASEMADAAEPITRASQGASGINLNNVTKLSDAVAAMVPVIDTLTGNGAEYSTKLSVVSDYAGLVSNIGNAFSTFDGIQNVNVEDIKKIPEILSALGEVSGELAPIETDFWGNVKDNPFENLVSQVNALGDLSVDVQNISSLATALETLSSDSVAKFTSGFDDSEGTVADAVDALIQNAVTAITESSESTNDAFEAAGKAFLTSLAEGMKDSSSVTTTSSDNSGAKALVEKIANSINSSENKQIIKKAGQQFVKSLAEGMSDTSDAGDVDTGGTQALVTEIVNSINNDSNAEIFKEAGKGFLESLAAGMADTSGVDTGEGGGAQTLVNQLKESILSCADDVASAGQEVVGELHIAIIQRVDLMIDAGRQLASAMSSGFSNNTGSIVQAAGAMASRARAAVASYEGAFYSIGVNMGLGLKSGIMSTAGQIASAAAEVVRQAVSAARSAGAINSPSKKTMEIGMYMDLGLADGLIKYATKSNAAAAGVANGVIDTVNRVLDIHSPSKVMIESGKNTVKGYLYGVSKEGELLTKKTRKLAQKALKQQLADDKDGNKIRIAQQIDEFNKRLKTTEDLGKKERQKLKAQLKALKKLQKDYGTPSGVYGDTADQLIKDTSQAIEDIERARMNSMSADEKKSYWSNILSQLDSSTEQYKEVHDKILDLNKEIENDTVEGAEKALQSRKATHNMSVKEEIEYWQQILTTLTAGSEAYLKVLEKLETLNNSIYDEILDSGQDRIDALERQTRNAISAIQKQQIWQDVLAQLPSDTKQYAEALAKIEELDREIENENLAAQEKAMSHRKETHDVSVDEEIRYWENLILQYKAGSEAYNNILEKLESLRNERLTEIVQNGRKQIEAEERKRMNSMSASEKQTIWRRIANQLPRDTKQYAEAMENLEDLNKEIENERLDDFDKYLSNEKERRDVSLGEELKYWKQKQKTFQHGTEAYEKTADTITSLNNQIYRSLKDSQESYQEGIKNAYKSLTKQLDDIWNQYEEDIKSRAKTLANTSGLFDFFESGTFESAETLIENLNAQVRGLDAFQTNLDALRRKVNQSQLADKEGFLDQLEDLGPSANANLENLLNMTNEQWDQYVALYNARAQNAMSEARKDVNVGDYNKQVEDAIQEANDSIADLTQTYYDGITDLGITIRQPSINVGASMVNGMIKGISDNEASLLAKVNSIANSTMNTAAKTLGIHSPSRKFAIFGQQIDLGLIQGLEAYQYKVTEVSAQVGEDSLQAMQNALDLTSLIANTDFDYNPVITPVLDDSLLAEGMNRIYGMMNQKKVIQLIPNDQMANLASMVSSQQIQNDQFSSMFNRLANMVASNGGSIINNNTFNIQSNDPREVANEVSRILNRQVQQKERVWA